MVEKIKKIAVPSECDLCERLIGDADEEGSYYRTESGKNLCIVCATRLIEWGYVEEDKDEA